MVALGGGGLFRMSGVPLYMQSFSLRQLKRCSGLLPEGQGQKLALTALCVTCSLDSGHDILTVFSCVLAISRLIAFREQLNDFRLRV